MSVTIVACLYGGGYAKFIDPWVEAIAGLTTRPDEVIVAADRPYEIPGALVIASDNRWVHPQAYYLQEAVEAARTEWVWIVDIDDQALPDGLDGIDQVKADVWVLGYERSDGHVHIPPQLTAAEYIAHDGNPFPAGSAIRVDSFRWSRGFPDIAFQDWGLWRRMARRGMTFQSSDRPHYLYNRHPTTRSATELMPGRRHHHHTEMLARG